MSLMQRHNNNIYVKLLKGSLFIIKDDHLKQKKQKTFMNLVISGNILTHL